MDAQVFARARCIRIEKYCICRLIRKMVARFLFSDSKLFVTKIINSFVKGEKKKKKN